MRTTYFTTLARHMSPVTFYQRGQSRHLILQVRVESTAIVNPPQSAPGLPENAMVILESPSQNPLQPRRFPLPWCRRHPADQHPTQNSRMLLATQHS